MRMTNRTNWILHKCTLHNRLHVLQWHLWCPGIDVRCLLKDVPSCTQGTQIQADMTQGAADSVPRRFLYPSCPNHPSPDSFPHFTRVSGLPPFIRLWIRPPTLRLLEKLMAELWGFGKKKYMWQPLYPGWQPKNSPPFLSESFLDLFRSDYFKYSKASVRRDQPSISSQWDPTPEVNSTVCCSPLLNVFLSSKALVSLGSVLVKFRCELHRWGILYG